MHVVGISKLNSFSFKLEESKLCCSKNNKSYFFLDFKKLPVQIFYVLVIDGEREVLQKTLFIRVEKTLAKRLLNLIIKAIDFNRPCHQQIE